MTPDQLRTRLDSLDLGISQFARMIGVDRTAVHKWLAPEDSPSHRKVPGPVVAYLELLQQIMCSAQRVGKTHLLSELEKARVD